MTITREEQDGHPAGTPTVVGPGAAVEGAIAGEGDLVVRGAVRGQVRVAGGVTVEPRGSVEAEVVAGGTVRLEDGSRVVGDVHAPRVVIVDGASFRGTLHTGGAPVRTADAPMASPAPPAEARAAAPATPAGPDDGLAAIAARIPAAGT
jgi:cytoskeletal protein CcmA (bactofilin family)